MEKKESPKKTYNEPDRGAPYNFVPLNNQTILSDWGGWKHIPPFNKYHKEYTGKKVYTGRIEIEATTKTPLYIRDLSHATQESEQPEGFFGETINSLRIPGSSIRGMIRNLVEIASYGKFLSTNHSKRMGYRALADRTSLGNEYRSMMINTNGFLPRSKAGLIRKKGSGYEIALSQSHNGVETFRISGSTRIVNAMPFFSWKEVYFLPEPELDHREGKMVYKYGLITQVSEKKEGEEWIKGYLIKTGRMMRQVRYWIIRSPEEKAVAMPIPDLVIKNYRDDITKDERADLLKKMDEGYEEIPCFCAIKQQTGKITGFGHNPYFRLISKKSIGDCIPKHLARSNDQQSVDPNPEHPDICQALFGCEDKVSGRVFFEDLTLSPGQKEVRMDKQSPKILSTPKPTSNQNYLEQPNGSDTEVSQLHHWNTDHARIRGYKLYWHRDTTEMGTNSWSEGRINEDTQHTTIQPIRSGTRFQGAIRFENLSEIELGALLYVLQLPENCAHKIGMGKPIGLGSTRFETKKLVIQDRSSAKGRYGLLFGKNGIWEEANTERYDPENPSFSAAFEQYIFNQITNKREEPYSKLSDVPRIKALFIMLDFNNTVLHNWLETTRYRDINKKEFKEKKVLPTPEEVVG